MAHLLWGEFMNFNANVPNWFDRDRFILSNGHARIKVVCFQSLSLGDFLLLVFVVGCSVRFFGARFATLLKRRQSEKRNGCHLQNSFSYILWKKSGAPKRPQERA
jgi:hypothetical protein